MNEQTQEKAAPVRADRQGNHPRMLILDDDPIVARMMRVHLLNAFPEAEVDICLEAMVPPEYDIYFLDNDFNGRLMGLRLLRNIRQISPHALVVALSNTLDMETMEQLMNGGCNAVYNKRYPERSRDARDVIRNYLDIVKKLKSGRASGKITDVARSLKQLVSEMNKRLDQAPASA
ncbi:MAG: response regulator [Puniceicoccaceae bacterium]